MNTIIFLNNVDCIADCGGADILRVIKFVFILLDIVLFIVPIALIIIIMFDFFKNVIASREDDMRKNVGIVIKRVIYCIALFLVPVITNFAISLVSGGEGAVNKAASCIEYAKNEDLSKCEVDYSELGSNSTNDNTEEETTENNQ